MPTQIGFPLSGIDPLDPIPGTRRELLLAQNPGGGGSQSLSVIFTGNKTSAGSETANTLGTYVIDDNDAAARFGKRSELYHMIRAFRMVDKNATVYAIAVPEDGAATATSFTWTIANAATDTTTMVIEWGGESVEFTVASGDSANTIAAALNSKINAQLYWPFTSTVLNAVVTVTCSQLGTRGDLMLGASLRAYLRKSVTTTVTKSALTAGTGEDDFTTAITALASQYFDYHICAKHATSTVTSTDNGIGEYIQMLRTAFAPTGGKEQVAFFGLVGTQSEAQAVAISSAANFPYAYFVHAENSPWFPGMVAAHHAAILRIVESNDPGANLTGYHLTDSTPYSIPAPYSTSDYPTETEIRANLNNGVTPVAFTTTGDPYVVRWVTSYSWNGSSTTKDYRAREGHIPLVTRFIWREFLRRWNATPKRSFAEKDPPRGQKPLPGVTYPGTVKDMWVKVVSDYCIGTDNQAGPLLDPDSFAAMVASVSVVGMTGGLSLKADIVAVKHLLKLHSRIAETSSAA